MKKTLALLLAALMALTAMVIPAMAETDMEYVKKKGVLVVGITDFKPMDYQDINGEWIGFDADMAKAFGEYLGVEVELVPIYWNKKIEELSGKTIDCVWNGMTLTDEVAAAMETSNAYANNAQVVILPVAKVNDYPDVASLAGLNFVVEEGSAGEKIIADLGYSYLPLDSQADTVVEVESKTADAAVIDALMAAALVGEGTNFADLTYTLPLNSEEYVVGFRKSSDLAAALNEFMAAAYADGTMMALAETYGVQAAIIPQ